MKSVLIHVHVHTVLATSMTYLLMIYFKQGLALINGTQLTTALGIEALHRAEIIAKQADVVAALTIDVLKGTPDAFDEGIIHITAIENKTNLKVCLPVYNQLKQMWYLRSSGLHQKHIVIPK